MNHLKKSLKITQNHSKLRLKIPCIILKIMFLAFFFFLEIMIIFIKNVLINFFLNRFISMNSLRHRNYKNENAEKKTLGTIG